MSNRNILIGKIYTSVNGVRYVTLLKAYNVLTKKMDVIYASASETSKVYSLPLEDFSAPVDVREYPETDKYWMFQRDDENIPTRDGSFDKNKSKQHPEIIFGAVKK